MKTLTKYSILLFIQVLLVGVFSSSCKKDDLPNDGKPIIYQVRLTDPAKADSSLTAAYMGSLVAIVGDNLGEVRELWFNDQEALLTPTFITDKAILVNVPSSLPDVFTDQIRLVFADGSELLYDFIIDIPPPILNSIKCEYVPEGGTVVLYGDYFFETEVTFPGGVKGEITDEQKTKLEVTVPAGATSGPIIVSNILGSDESVFRFRDDRNIIVDFDTSFNGNWTADIVYADSNPDPSPCSGNYVTLFSTGVGHFSWQDKVCMQYIAESSPRGNVPLATGLVSQLVLRFEVNIPDPWSSVRMEIYCAPYGAGHGRDLLGPTTPGAIDSIPITSFARWDPWIDAPYTTDGWITMSIPLSEFKFGRDDAENATNGTRPMEDISSLTNITMMVFGPHTGDNVPININIDNVRIVPLE